MAKEMVLSSRSIEQLVHCIAEVVADLLKSPGPVQAPHETEMPVHLRCMLETRTTALHAAIQVAHTPQDVVEAAQRFAQFLQQGT